MGCGSSSAAGASRPMEKDPEDFHLEHIEFKTLNVEKFDTFLEEVKGPVNSVVDISNEINDCITEIKDAVALALGAFRVEIKVSGVTHYDTVHVTVTKADGTPAPHADLAKLAEDAKVKAVDADLYKALTGLHASKPTGLAVAADALTGAGVDALNKAVADLRAAVGDAYKVVVAVKASPAHGSSTISAHVVKPKFASPDSDQYTLVPVTLFDIVSTKEAKNIAAAEMSVAEATGALSKAVKDAEAAGVTVEFTLKKKKIQVKLTGGEGDDANDAKSAVRKAVSTTNSQLFKLIKSCANANGDVNIVKALLVVVDSLLAKVKKTIGGAPDAAMDAAKKAIKVAPKLDISAEGEIDFDMDFKINLPDFEGKDWKELLSGPAKLAYKTVMDVKDKLVELFPRFKELAEQVKELVDKTGEVFESPMDAIKEAMPEAETMAMMKLAKDATMNAAKVKDGAKVVQVFIQTAKRIGDELQKAIDEIKVMLPA